MIPTFEAGQIWKFHARPGEEAARIAILAVRNDDRIGQICSIAIGGVAIPNPHLDGGVQETLPHAPITSAVLADAVIELEAIDGPTAQHPDFTESYGQWAVLFEKGEAGVFTISPAEILDTIESVVAKGAGS